jgi:hypothetical protein
MLNCDRHVPTKREAKHPFDPFLPLPTAAPRYPGDDVELGQPEELVVEAEGDGRGQRCRQGSVVESNVVCEFTPDVFFFLFVP